MASTCSEGGEHIIENDLEGEISLTNSIVCIDNACSFGKLVPGNENVNRLVGIDNMLVISKILY